MRAFAAPRGCPHFWNAWCADCHDSAMAAAKERGLAIESVFRTVGQWLRRAHRQRSVAFKSFSGQPMEQAKLEAQTHLLAQVHLILAGQLYLLNHPKKGP